MKVFVLTSGIYSDYSIKAIFSSRKKAEEYKSYVRNTDYNDLEEYTIDPDTVDNIKKGYSIWRVLMLRNGNVEKVYRENSFDYLEHCFIWKRTNLPAYIGKNIQDVLSAIVWAKSEQHAIKIVNEKRAQMIANNEWK